MPISEVQLTTWSYQGSITNSKATADSVKYAIDSYKKFPTGIAFNTYLQGSYKNDTNIFGESDVDVLVQLTSSFYNNLTEEQKAKFNFTKADYGYFRFRDDVLNCLKEYYEVDIVKPDNKVIRIFPKSNRLHADVLVCCDYRKYYSLNDENSFHGGIAFYTRNENSRIVNFPSMHSAGGTQKHQNTNGWFKPTVRIFKNIRKYLTANKQFDKKLAPSYFIECFLGNLPDNLFGKSYQATVYSILKYERENSWDKFMCLNGIVPLWGDAAENWNPENAKQFFNSVIEFWNESG